MFKNDLDIYLETNISPLKCQEETKAYIKGILSEFARSTENDLSKTSLTLMYAKAKLNIDFITFRNIGDWLFYCKTFFPESLSAASSNYYDLLAQSSYYKCYLILNKKWILYEELSDQFNNLVHQLNSSIAKEQLDKFSLTNLSNKSFHRIKLQNH